MEIGREATVGEHEQSTSPLKRLALVLACWLVAAPFVALGMVLGLREGFGRTIDVLSTVAHDNPLVVVVALLGGVVGALLGAALSGAALAAVGLVVTYVHRWTRHP